MKWAVMVPWDNDGYIYVTRPTGEMYELEPVLYDTEDLAREHAAMWGRNAKVVVYKEKYEV
jgi:hypothetical protein